MSKLPVRLNRSCPKCRTSTSHTVQTVKSGKASPFSKIMRIKSKKPGIGNQGKFSKVPAKKKKQSRRPHIILTCTGKSCAYKSNLVRPRCNKYEIR